MAYQHYDNGGRPYEDRYHDYRETRRPSYQPAGFVDPYDHGHYPEQSQQHEPYQGYATYGHDNQGRYSTTCHDRYDAHVKHASYTPSHSTSDYISPPVESRHDYDYILPQQSSTDRHGTQKSQPQGYEKRGNHDQSYQRDPYNRHGISEQQGYTEPRVGSRPVSAEKSNYQMLKESGFDTKHDMMRSYGIKPWDIDAYDQVNDILDGFRHIDAHNYQSQDFRSQPGRARPHRPHSSQHRYERAVPRESTQSQRPSSSRYKDESESRYNPAFHDSDMETCIDSDVPERGYISGSDIASFKSGTSPNMSRYWSRSPSLSTHRQDLPDISHRIGRSVSQSPSRWWGNGDTRSYPYSNQVYDSYSDQQRHRGRFVSSSPITRTRRYPSTSIRSRSRSRVLSSGESILSYRSSTSPSVFAGSDYFDGHGGSRHVSEIGSGVAIDSGSDLSGSDSGSGIESADEYDVDDYLDDGFDEQIEDELEFDDY